jgi:hypothetical protein
VRGRFLSLVPRISTVCVGLLAGGVLVLTTPTSAFAVSCAHRSNHEYETTLRAGTAFGDHGGGLGLYLGASGAGSLQCTRVASAFSYHDGNNFEELGALQDVSGSVACLSGHGLPTDGNWYKYWFERVSGSVFCASSSEITQQSANSWHTAQIYRDATNTTDWHLTWDGHGTLLQAPIVSSGYPIGGTERWNTSDSASGVFDGDYFMKTDNTWHQWSNRLIWDNSDYPAYVICLGTNTFKIAKAC